MNAGSDGLDIKGRNRRQLVITGLGLAGIVAVAVGVRLYRLDAQSLWYDDFNSITGLHAHDLATYLIHVRNFNSEHVPLYFLIEYVWGRLAGTSPSSIRLLSVFFGVSTVPLVYLFGRDIYGKKAGLIAALCLALSPIHIFNSQAIRPYSLVVLLAALSLWALVRASQGRGATWWAVNFVANVLLIWTHVFGLLLVLVQGCLLGVFLRGRRRQAVVWVALHLLALIPWAWWVHTMPSMREQSYAMYHAPSVRNVFNDLVGDDAVNLNVELLPLERTWGFMPERSARVFLRAHTWFDRGLVLAFCLCIGWVAAKLVRSRAEAGGGPRDDRARASAESSTLLLFVAFLPVLALAALSYVWRPCIFPRYTLHSSLALYVMAGGAIQSIRGPGPRRCAVAVLVLLYGYQLSLTLPSATRTNWLEAAEYVRSDATSRDMIFVGRSGAGSANPAIDIFRRHMGPTGIRIIPVHTLQGLCDKSAYFFRKQKSLNAASGSTSGKEPVAWAVLVRNYQSKPLPELEEGLASRGLKYTHREFQAMECLIVYRIVEDPDFDFAKAPRPTVIDTGVDYEKTLGALGFMYTDLGQKNEAIAILRRALDSPTFPLEDPRCLAELSLLLADEGGVDLSIAVARRALELDPEGTPGNLALGMGLLQKGKRAEARVAFQKALASVGDPLMGIYEPLLVALVEQNHDKLRDAVGNLQKMGYHVATPLLMQFGLAG